MPISHVRRVKVLYKHINRIFQQLSLHTKIKRGILLQHLLAGSGSVARVMCPAHYKCQLRSSYHGFAVVALMSFDIADGVVSRLKSIKQSAPFLKTFRRSLDPGHEFLLQFFLLLDHIETLKAFLLSAEALLHVAQTEEIIGVFQTDVRILVHPAFDDGHLVAADRVVHRMSQCFLEISLERAAVTVSASRISDDHGVVSRLVAVEGNRKLAGRFHRDIVLRISGR